MRALLSVFDKTGIEELARFLTAKGYQIISSGGTSVALEKAGIPVTQIPSITGFPEILDGRVKTLHPRIHGGILARDTSLHRADLGKIEGEFIDLVVVNLYPFEQVSSDSSSSDQEIIENIDIGGPALLRSAAKNHERVTVVCDPSDYGEVMEMIESDTESLARRKKLAAKAFAHTAFYDSLIARYLEQDPFSQKLTLPLKQKHKLRYGENPHQEAFLYEQIPASKGIIHAQQLQGKELSFNNYLDADAAWQLVSEFTSDCVVALKHANPCAVALGKTMAEAYRKAHSCDPVSIFGGIVACNREVDAEAAKEMCQTFLEIVVAPSFTAGALELFKKRVNLRLLKMELLNTPGLDWKRVSGGFLVQSADRAVEDDWKVVTEVAPSAEQLRDLAFAMTCVKYVKSNAIAVAKEGMLLGVGAGQMNRVQSMKLALENARAENNGAVVASDGFFPFADSIEEAVKHGISAIIQPGGSKRDSEVIEACNRNGIAMICTGIRHFRH